MPRSPRLALHLLACLLAGHTGAWATSGSAAPSPLAFGATTAAEASASVIDPAKARVTAQASGRLELFINGQFMGRAIDARQRLSAYARALRVGDNVIVLRVRSQDAASFAYAQLQGEFGRAVSNSGWRARLASAGEAAEANGPWSRLDYHDSDWAPASERPIPRPSGFPSDGAARSIWPANAGPGVALFRLRLWVPDAAAARPQGWGSSVTGGSGGERVRVRTPAELASALCRTRSGSTCTDTTPRIIEVASTLDFRGSEGPDHKPGCYQAVCPAPMQSERLIVAAPGITHCDGKPTFSVAFDAAGRTPLLVGSNKTLIGIGDDGVIKGKGLMLRGGVSNIAIRNLSFSDINPGIVFAGDAITLDDTDRVWIDHNRFQRIGRQHIVSGWGKASRVTISWNQFDGRSEASATCNGQHYWMLLLVGKDDSITFANNWLHDFSGRSPKIGTAAGRASVQLVNNYLQRGKGHAIDVTAAAQVLVEGNYFTSVHTPLVRHEDAGGVWAPLGIPDSGAQAACRAALGRDCAGNEERGALERGGFRVQPSVLERFKADGARHTVTPYPASKVPEVVPHLAGPGHL